MNASKKILYYKPSALAAVASETLPGTEALSYFFKLYNAGAIPIDRTDTFVTPVQIQSRFPMPAFRTMTKTFEELCNERASDIVKRSDATGKKIFVLWSGGIDSTLVLVSLLKNATEAQKGRIVVLLSKESIAENPDFYRDHVRGKLQVDTSSILSIVLGSPDILVSGEHNDQIFGSDMTVALISKFGGDIIHRPFVRSLLSQHFMDAMENAEVTDLYLGLFEKLWKKSPVPLVSFFDHLWWVNFSLKWQTVYMRMLTFVAPSNAPFITEEYLQTNYAPFYNTEEFQLWSLNNHDKKIKDTWVTYKWPCKDIIYDFTKDAVYRDTKVKVGSLAGFVRNQVSYKFIDESLGLHQTLNPLSYFNPQNDFILKK